MDIISHINQTNKRAVIISIDYEKCFDRIEHRSIYAAMKYFNIGDRYIQWIAAFFTDFRLCTQNAGNTSQYFVKGRGVNQGYPISPFCFNICGETMSHLIKNNPKIVGINLNDNSKSEVRHVITQFADDTGLFLMYSEDCLNAVIDTLAYVEKNTGLKVSYDKTCIYRIGSLKKNCAQIHTTKQLKWSDGDIEMLGVTIAYEYVQSNKQFDPCIDKMQAVADNRTNRNLTLTGKIIVINTLMCSIFAYKMAVLPVISEIQCKRIDAFTTNYIWKGKKSKIPLKLLQNNKKLGGLKLSNFKQRQK